MYLMQKLIILLNSNMNKRISISSHPCRGEFVFLYQIPYTLPRIVLHEHNHQNRIGEDIVLQSKPGIVSTDISRKFTGTEPKKLLVGDKIRDIFSLHHEFSAHVFGDVSRHDWLCADRPVLRLIPPRSLSQKRL